MIVSFLLELCHCSLNIYNHNVGLGFFSLQAYSGFIEKVLFGDKAVQYVQ